MNVSLYYKPKLPYRLSPVSSSIVSLKLFGNFCIFLQCLTGSSIYTVYTLITVAHTILCSGNSFTFIWSREQMLASRSSSCLCVLRSWFLKSVFSLYKISSAIVIGSTVMLIGRNTKGTVILYLLFSIMTLKIFVLYSGLFFLY